MSRIAGSRPPLRAGLFLLCASLLGAGCGKVGDPLPPIIAIPQEAADFSVVQSGYELHLAWTNPLRNLDQSAVADLASAVIEADGAVVAEVPAGPPGERQTLSLDARGRVGATAAFTVRFTTRAGRTSAPSAPVTVAVLATPGGVRDLAATVDQNRVVLEWNAPAEGAALVDGHRVYRSGALAAELGDGRRFEDDFYLEGEERTYQVVAFRRSGTGVVEGERAAPLAVRVVDRTPPGAPAGVAVNPTPPGVFVTWEASPEGDVVLYRVFRREAGGAYALVSGGTQTTTGFADPSYDPGHEYAIQAVDRSGNESPLSPPAAP